MITNQRNLLTTETRTHEGRTFRVDVVFDESTSAPWDEYDTLGTVSDWTRDRKPAGSKVLNEDRGSFRYYDWAGAVAKARKEGMTGADAAEAVEREFTRLRRWCENDWCWVGVVVTPLTPDGDALDSMSDSLWGIESDADDHIDEVTRDLMYSLTKTLNEKEAA